MTTNKLKIALMSVALVAVLALAGAGAVVSAQTQADLTNSTETVSDVAPGENVTVEVEFTSADSGTLELVHNSTQTLEFETDTGNYSISVTDGEVIDSAVVEATSQDINDSTTGSFIDVNELTLSFPGQSGTLSNPETLDVRVKMTGINSSAVNQTAVQGPSDDGLFGGIGGDSTTSSLLLFAAVVGGLYVARQRNII